MALIPTKYTHSVFFPAPTQEPWLENTGGSSITIGWYVDRNRPDEEIMIESHKSILNQFGHEISTIEEEWDYSAAGCAPTEYRKTEYSRAYLPGIGGQQYRKVQEEKVIFWTLTPLAQGDNLTNSKFVSGYVVYDLPQDPTASTSTEGQEKAADAGFTPSSQYDRIVESGKLWSESNISNNTIPSEQAGQTAIWMNNVVEEIDYVVEEWDKWTIWRMKKNALRSAGVTWTGPRYIKKENKSYRLGVPIQPPVIITASGTDQITIAIDGGGAKITNPYFGPAGTFHIRPEKYKLYRAKITEPERTSDDNIYGMWMPGEGPGAPPVRTVIGNDAVVDYSGTPTSDLPSQESYTEEEDPTPEPPGPDTSFHLIATLLNVNSQDAEGHADWVDQDCEDGGEYEYYAVAEVRDEESPDSNHERETFSGTGSRRYRISIFADEEATIVDAIAPDDPLLPEVDYGELFKFEIPTTEDPLFVGTTIADRQYSANREPDFRIQLAVQLPSLGLEFGQLVRIPAVSWEAFGNGIHMSTSIQDDDWSLVGFNINAERTPNGDWRSPETNMVLQRFPRIR